MAKTLPVPGGPPATAAVAPLRGPQWETLMFVPNLIGYARVLASFWALQQFCTALAMLEADGRQQAAGSAAGGEAGGGAGDGGGGLARPEVAGRFVVVMLMAAFLDVIDGPLARALGQTSTLGVYVDIVADNVWRTATWVAVVVADPGHAWLSLLVIAVEWLTFFASQVTVLTKRGASEVQQTHWKAQSAHSASLRLRRWYFRNGFRNPVGALGIAGLFLLPLVMFVDAEFGTSATASSPQPHSGASFAAETVSALTTSTFWAPFKYAMVLGRVISMIVEVDFVREWTEVVVTPPQ